MEAEKTWSARREAPKPFSSAGGGKPHLRLLNGEGGGVAFDNDGQFRKYTANGGAFSFAQLGFDLGGQEKVVSPFSENTFVRAAVKAFSAGVNRLKLEMWDGDPADEGTVRVKDNKLLNLLKRPNSRQTQKQFFKGHTTAMKLFGESMWFFADGRGRPVSTTRNGLMKSFPDQIIQVPGNQVECERDSETGWIKSYRYSIAGKSSRSSQSFPAAAVLHFLDYDPSDVTRGFGDAEACVRPMDIQHQILRYLDASLRNGGAPSGMLVVPNGVSPDERERLEAEVNDDLELDNAGKIKVIDGDAKFFPNNMSPKDFEYGDLWNGMTSAILTCLGAPEPVVGIYERATYENVRTAFLEFWRGTNGVLALAGDTADVITGLLIPRMRLVMRGASGYVARFDHSDIEVLQEDRINELTLAREIAKGGFGMSFNDALDMLSMSIERKDSGDKAFVAQGLTDVETGKVYGPKQNSVSSEQLKTAFKEYHEQVQRTRSVAP